MAYGNETEVAAHPTRNEHPYGAIAAKAREAAMRSQLAPQGGLIQDGPPALAGMKARAPRDTLVTASERTGGVIEDLVTVSQLLREVCDLLGAPEPEGQPVTPEDQGVGVVADLHRSITTQYRLVNHLREQVYAVRTAVGL